MAHRQLWSSIVFLFCCIYGVFGAMRSDLFLDFKWIIDSGVIGLGLHQLAALTSFGRLENMIIFCALVSSMPR